MADIVNLVINIKLKIVGCAAVSEMGSNRHE